MRCHGLGPVLLLWGALAGAGCLPFVTPPARVSVGPALRVPPVRGGSEVEPGAQLTSLRAAAHPLDLADEAERHWLDLGLGYQAEFAARDDVATVHGPYLELGAYPLEARLGSGVTLRGGAYGTVDGLWRRGTSDAGLGGSLGLLLEASGSSAGTFAGAGDDGSVVAGFARGRWGVGVWGSGALRDFSDGAYRSLAMGVSVRLPLLAGVVCCALPDFSGHGHGSKQRSPRAAGGARRLQREPARPTRRQ